MTDDVQRVARSATDVAIFAVGKGPAWPPRSDCLLEGLLRALNEMQGYCREHFHIAHLEGFLEFKGQLSAFHRAWRTLTNTEWSDERDSYAARRAEVLAVLSSILGRGEQECERWLDGPDNNFPLSVENFCTWVSEYLQAKNAGHRALFVVEDVDRFISADVQRMMQLQFINESLERTCQGRASVVVVGESALSSDSAPFGVRWSLSDSQVCELMGRYGLVTR